MKKIKLVFAIALYVSLMVSCNTSKQVSMKLTAEKIEMLKPKISQLGTKWSKGLKAKDASIIKNIYAEDAHYLPDSENAIHGIENIAKQWNNFMGILLDLQLNLETLEGTEELLYETGTGTVTVANQSGGSDNFPFKYVNIWELQSNGEYKVVIDIYNDVKPQ